VGSPHENPITLNRNDADGERGIWDQEEIYGKWKVRIEKGIYNVKFKFIKPIDADGIMYLETNGIINKMKNIKINTDIIEMNNIDFPHLEGDLIPFYAIDGKKIFPFWVEMTRVNL
jgi:hypothetical protein